MTDNSDRFAALEQRIGLLEDHLELTRLIYSYAPAVDSGSAEVVSGIWEEDGVYDVDTGAMRGRAEIEAMVRSSSHQGYIHGGCGHVTGPAHITVDGDTAVATLYTQLIKKVPDADGFDVSRVTANRWEFARGAQGWRVTIRKSRVLDGRSDARDILAAGVAPVK